MNSFAIVVIFHEANYIKSRNRVKNKIEAYKFRNNSEKKNLRG